jgi:hypothetical protein
MGSHGDHYLLGGESSKFSGIRFTCLLEPDAIDASHRRAEHALRPAVFSRLLRSPQPTVALAPLPTS